MKLTLVSITFQGIRRSAFLMLDAVNPKVSQSDLFRVLGFFPPLGSTFSIG
jgi:hypothetical protein